VTYLFSGRHYPYVRGPRLKRWQNGGVAMLEVVNSPLYDHGRQPELELGEPGIEHMLERVISDVRPDVVHVQELAGLPSSLLDVSRNAGVPTIFTLQDYFPLCATFRLLDADGHVCLRREIGADCVAGTAADPREPGVLIRATLLHDLLRIPLLRRVSEERVVKHIEPRARSLARRAAAARSQPRAGPAALAEAFQRRRDVNVARLNRTDRLLAMSHRVAEIYTLLGVNADRISTRQLTLGHIERLRPRRPDPNGRLTFATLSGLESTAKGARVLINATKSVRSGLAAGRCRLLVFGHVDPEVLDEARHLPGVELRGHYSRDELDSLLDEVDVGIIPSIWEEAYGYVGIEFLAKGIPVIANAIGGLVEYTRDGETGWLNRSSSSEELARIMHSVIDNPAEVEELNARIRAQRDSIVKPLARHADEMDAIYEATIAGRGL
jgi:glycosyltransferase involved in cell wall biosynthesis